MLDIVTANTALFMALNICAALICVGIIMYEVMDRKRKKAEKAAQPVDGEFPPEIMVELKQHRRHSILGKEGQSE